MTKVIISSRRNLEGEVKKLEEQKGRYAIISIADPGASCAEVPKTKKLHARLCLNFLDVVPSEVKEEYGDKIIQHKERWGFINGRQVQAIRSFIKATDEHVDTWIFQCEAGISRSSAIALYYYYAHKNGDDTGKILSSKSKYFPNPFVLFSMVGTNNPKLKTVKKEYERFLKVKQGLLLV